MSGATRIQDCFLYVGGGAMSEVGLYVLVFSVLHILTAVQLTPLGIGSPPIQRPGPWFCP